MIRVKWFEEAEQGGEFFDLLNKGTRLGQASHSFNTDRHLGGALNIVFVFKRPAPNFNRRKRMPTKCELMKRLLRIPLVL
jgi:hypothetical protein